MIHLFLNVKNFIPKAHVPTIYDIDLNALKQQGIKTLLFDIDNTIIPYDEAMPNQTIKDFFKSLEAENFTVGLISNNNKRRIKPFSDALDLPYVFSAKKPLKSGFKKIHKHLSVDRSNNTVMVGDQLMTDVYGAKRYGIDAILVDPIKQKTEKWYTKINRIIEKKMLKRIAKKYPDTYQNLELYKR